MRPGQQNKRGRGRGNNNNNNNGGGNSNFNRKGSNPLTRTYDSSGPDVKIRGTAQHIAEKYATLARDAQSAGDRVMAENYLQHAEHYNRIIAAAQAQMQERFQREERGDYNDREAVERDADDIDVNETVAEEQPVVVAAPAAIDGTGPQPVIEGTPVEVAAEEEAQAAAPRERSQTRRRSPTQRPRRQPRRNSDAAEGEVGEAAEAPASEAPEAPALAAVEAE